MGSQQPLIRYVVGDIGGTNTRLSLLELHDPHQSFSDASLVREKVYSSQKYFSLADVILEFLSEELQFRYDITANGNRWPKIASFAVAGPVVRNRVELTNLSWGFLDGNQLANDLSFTQIEFMNDFLGLGYGLLALKENDRIHLNPGVKPQAGSPIACLGAGTGLGETFLTWNGEYYDCWPTEGGHCDLAATDSLEFELLQYIKKTKDLTHVSAERAISGQALPTIYEFLKEKHPDLVCPETEEDLKNGKDAGSVIGTRGQSGQDKLSAKVLEMFIGLYGSEAGNLALKVLPYGGLYVAGGVAPKLISLFKESDVFMKKLVDKGRMKKILEQVPVYVVTYPQVGLLGARVIAHRLIVKHYGQEKEKEKEKESVILTIPSLPRANLLELTVGWSLGIASVLFGLFLAKKFKF